MKIETKFNVGQEVWMMYENKPILAKIAVIGVRVMRDDISERYVLDISIEPGNFTRKADILPEDLYNSKKELIETL